jgi:hypothetical protein
MFIVNYLWDLPKASKVAPNTFVRWAFDNWQFSGITNLSSGLPQSVGFTTVDNADITGGGDGVRPVVIAPVPLSSGERGFSRWFNTAAFGRPAQNTFGNAAIRTYRGPGISNWDINLSKNFPFRSEQRYLQFRAEFYNIFNHTQFQAVNSSARFDAAGQQVNGEFGQVVATRSPRVVQFGLRFSF